MFEAAQVWRNQSQWHFCVVNSTFIFTFIYGFLQALKQDNKKYLFKCTAGFTFQFQSVQRCSACGAASLSVAPKIFGPDVWWHPPPLSFWKKSTQQNQTGLFAWNTLLLSAWWRPVIITLVCWWKEFWFTVKDVETNFIFLFFGN